MDAEQQIITLLTEQNELLKKHLWRFRFSLLSLLVLTTLSCCCLGFVIYTQQKVRRPVTWPIPAGGTLSPYTATVQPVLPQSATPIPASAADADPSDPFK